MAISGFGAIAHSGVQLCKRENKQVETSKFLKTGTATALNVTDTLLGVTLVVLGILALLNILPLPASFGGQGLAYLAIGAGAVNILASLLRSYQGTKAALADCCAAKAPTQRRERGESVVQ